MTSAGPTRQLSLDLARGIVTLFMVQAHAFHAWVTPSLRDDAYAVTRVLAALPLPMYLLLSGGAVALRARPDDTGFVRSDLRRELARRGAELMLLGYAVNVAYALIDGASGWHTFLRADVLHIFGLSLLSTSVLLRLRLVAAERAIIALGLLTWLSCAYVTRFSHQTPATFAPFVALFGEVPLYGSMPFFPLYAWFAAGFVSFRWLAQRRFESKALWTAFAVALGLAIVSDIAIGPVVQWMGGVVSRTHPAIAISALISGSRAFLLFACCALLLQWQLLSQNIVVRQLIYFGKASLFVYVFHIPFCYGKLSRLFGALAGHDNWRMKHSGDVLDALPWVLALIALSFAALRVRDGVVGLAKNLRFRNEAKYS